MFYCLRAPKHPFGSGKGKAIGKGLTEGGRRNTLSRKREGGMGKDEGLFSAAVSGVCVLKTVIGGWAEMG